MVPDDTALPGGDWSFPPVESLADVAAEPAVDAVAEVPAVVVGEGPAESVGDVPAGVPADVPADFETAETVVALPGPTPDLVHPPVVGHAPLPGAATPRLLPSSGAAPRGADGPSLPSGAGPSRPGPSGPGASLPSQPGLSAGSEEPPPGVVSAGPRRFPVTRPPISPLRAVAGAAVAVAGVLLGIGALLWATDAPTGSPALQQTQAQSSPVTSSPAATSPSANTVMATPAPLQTRPAAAAPTGAPKLPLTVLNNSNVNRLAKRSAARFHAAGWPIALTGGFRGRIAVTTVYYAPGQEASAFLLQKEFPAIQRVHPRFTGLPGSGLTVVLTRDYPG